jgi:hypothetical protein
VTPVEWAVDAPAGAEPARVATAIGEGRRTITVRGRTVRVIPPTADEATDDDSGHTTAETSVLTHVSPITPETTVPLGPALAAAARSRGHTIPQDDDIEAVRSELAATTVPSTSTREARRRVATAGEAERELDERVAELRGRLGALRERGSKAEVTEATAALTAAVERLTEVRTERIAAEQVLDRARREARSVRDARERRLHLEDRVANLERAARSHLLAAMWEQFVRAVAEVPPPSESETGSLPTVGPTPGEYEGDGTTAALAVCRAARLRKPVVVACGRFPDAQTAAARLDAPVVQVPCHRPGQS